MRSICKKWMGIIFLLLVVYQASVAQRATSRPGTSSNQTINKNNTGTDRPAATTPLKPEERQKAPAGMNGQAVVRNFRRVYDLTDKSSITRSFTLISNQKMQSLNNASANPAATRPQRGERSADARRTAEGMQHCETQQGTVSANNISEFATVFAQTDMLSNIYPGAMYDIDDLYSGAFKPITYDRNPMTLVTSVKNLSGTTYVQVANPNKATLTTATANLFARHSNAEGEVGYEGFVYNISKVETAAEVDFRLNAGGHYLTIAASNSFASNEKVNHRYLLIEGIKRMFSITADPHMSTSSNEAFTNRGPAAVGTGLLKDASKINPDMVYVSKVGYGARVIALVQLDITDRTVADKFSGSAEFLVAGGSVQVSAYLRNFNSTMRISYYSVGGNSSQATTAGSFEEMEANVKRLFAGLNYKNAQPVSYSLSNINHEVVLSRSATDNFTVQNCYVDRDMEVLASLNGISKISGEDTDIDLFGQVWARAFDGKGNEIYAAGGRDRLMDVQRDQRLNERNLNGPGWTPNMTARFIIPAGTQQGAKIVIYYWLVDKDDFGESSDDVLTRRNGNGEKMKDRRGIVFEARQFTFSISGANYGDEFVDQDGKNGVKLNTVIRVNPIGKPASGPGNAQGGLFGH